MNNKNSKVMRPGSWTAFRITCVLTFGIVLGISVSGAENHTAPPLEVQPFFFALSVKNVEKSSEWYERVLGFREVRSIDLEDRGTRLRLMRLDRGSLELVELSEAQSFPEVAPDLKKRYLAHGVFKIGFEVRDLDEAIAGLDALKVKLRGDAFTEADGSMRSAQVEDPDGNIIQLFQILITEQ